MTTKEELWIVESTTYIGSNPIWFNRRNEAEEYIEGLMNKGLGFSEKNVQNNITIYVENSNKEDVYVLRAYKG